MKKWENRTKLQFIIATNFDSGSDDGYSGSNKENSGDNEM